MIISEKELKIAMHALLDELEKSQDKATDGKIIAKAVNLGMQYQEAKIKSGINIVFNELHKNK